MSESQETPKKSPLITQQTLSKGLALVAGITILGSGFFLYRSSNEQQRLPYAFISAKRQTIASEINAEGTVKPAQAIDLAFELSGNVATINAAVGQHVKIGDVLATVHAETLNAGVATANASLAQAQAELSAQEALLLQTKNGATQEQREALQASVDAAQKQLERTKETNQQLMSQREASLVSSMQTSMNQAREALFVLTDIQYAHFSDYGPESSALADAKAEIMKSLFSIDNAGRYNRGSISPLNSGLFGTVSSWSSSSTAEQLNATATKTLDPMKLIERALKTIPQKSSMSSAEFAQITSALQSINAQITAMTNAQSAYGVQKAQNDASLISAQNALDAAQHQLAITQAGTREESVRIQQAQVERAKANIQAAQAAIAAASANAAKSVMRSPINGIVTRIVPEQGQFIATGSPIISLMSDGAFQIESYVPQTEITRISKDQMATISLDGASNEYRGRVVLVDPTSTKINNVDAYRLLIQFDEENDVIKAGMHANIHITLSRVENAIVIPSASVIRNNNETYVFVNDKAHPQRTVTLGITGNNGMVEILDGLNEGDSVASFGN